MCNNVKRFSAIEIKQRKTLQLFISRLQRRFSSFEATRKSERERERERESRIRSRFVVVGLLPDNGTSGLPKKFGISRYARYRNWIRTLELCAWSKALFINSSFFIFSSTFLWSDFRALQKSLARRYWCQNGEKVRERKRKHRILGSVKRCEINQRNRSRNRLENSADEQYPLADWTVIFTNTQPQSACKLERGAHTRSLVDPVDPVDHYGN